MADFRNVRPSSISWNRGGRGGGVFASIIGEKNIRIQVPKTNCFVSPHSPGMFKLELQLSPQVPIHAQFIDWIADLEYSSKGPWGDVKLSSAIYKNGMRVMFFSDTNCFDSNGEMSADFAKAKSASLIFTLVGLWIANGKYGLKFKVDQLKYSEDKIEYPPTVSEDSPPVETECMFIDD